MMKRILIFVGIVSLFLAGCGGNAAPTSAPPTSAPAPLPAIVQPTNPPPPTQAPSSTEGPAPTAVSAQATDTMEPTTEVQPTAAAQPTSAAQPTAATGDLQPPSGDPFDVLKNATLARLQAKSFRTTTTIESGDSKPTNLLI